MRVSFDRFEIDVPETERIGENAPIQLHHIDIFGEEHTIWLTHEQTVHLVDVLVTASNHVNGSEEYKG